MSAATLGPRPARAALPGRARRRPRRSVRDLGRGLVEPVRIDLDPRRPVVLRCPGPLVALRSLAALYGVSAERLAALLPECEARTPVDPEGSPGALADVVGNALGAPLTPRCVHYFRSAWLAEPRGALEHGVCAGPPGSLVRDVLLRPGLHSGRDHVAAREFPVTTACIVEHRRPPARDGADVDAALWFVAAALRGAVIPQATGADDGAAIAARDIVSVRAVATQAEWTPAHSTR